MKLTGAQIILKKLIQHRVKHIFEFPGGSICPILDEFYKHKKIRVITTRHEQAAVHAADAFARVTKLPSVCMATSGPGAANLVTGIANAYMDSIPLVIITGQVAVWDIKRNKAVRQRGFQELDIVSVVKSITKKAFLVTHVSKLAKTIDEAFAISISGRPGPVLIDVPINVQYSFTEFRNEKIKIVSKKPSPSKKDIKFLIHKLLRCKKPLIIVGGGVILSGAEKELQKLLKLYNFPVCQTLMGLTAVPQDYAFGLGMVGYAGIRAVHTTVKEADFVLGLGLRFDNRAFPEARKEFSKKCFIIHVDCDRAELNHRVLVDKAIFADVKGFLKLFNRALEKNSLKIDNNWFQRIKSLKEQTNLPSLQDKLSPGYILTKLSDLLSAKEAIITTDVGQHQLWTAQFFKFRKANSLITSGGLGTMGFGLPAAIGAKLANPKAEVVNITSDGSFQMNIQELATIKDSRLPIKIIILNNKCLGLVRQIQEFAFCQRYASTRHNAGVDFTKIGRSYGINCIKATLPNKVDSVLKNIVSSKSAFIVEFMINEFENVYPIRIKGKTIYNNATA